MVIWRTKCSGGKNVGHWWKSKIGDVKPSGTDIGILLSITLKD